MHWSPIVRVVGRPRNNLTNPFAQTTIALAHIIYCKKAPFSYTNKIVAHSISAHNQNLCRTFIL